MSPRQGPQPPAAMAETFGAALHQHQSGRLQDAEALYRKILSLDPSHVGSLHYLGVLAHQTGRSEQAAGLIARAIALNPAIPDCHYNLGLVQSALGRLDAAAGHFRKAAELKPDYVEAHMDLGTVLKRQRKPDDAAACYRRALQLRPDSAPTHYNLANLLAEQGRLAEAVDSYQQAIKLAPSVAIIHNNLGAALLAQNNFIGAVVEYQNALRCDPKLTDAAGNIGRVIDRVMQGVRAGGGTQAKTLFVHCVENLSIVPDDVDLRTPLLAALTEAWGRPADLLGVCTAVLKKNPAIRACIDRTATSWPTRLAALQLFGPSERAALADDALLRCLLQSTRLADMAIERLLTDIRAIMLDEAIAVTEIADAGLLAFGCALAQQCFLNDYVYDAPAAELARAVGLRERLAAAWQAGHEVPAAWLVAVAAYFPLGAVPGSRAALARSWPPAVSALLAQQVAEPAEEGRLRDTIPRITPIEDDVSLAVERQYSENPYPRWVRSPSIDTPMSLDEYVGGMFPLAPFRKLAKTSGADILIAGCGTGQQALDVAGWLAASRILAIDLSLPSLAYATRKARELGIANIAFAQADILKLGALGRVFDSIEAMGVLHHLADPWAGWAVLLSLLAPGGVMRIGLYSELARQDIVAARKLIAERGYRPTADDIRRCRQDLIAVAADERLHFVRESWDFFSISECRDLLFHVQEHRMTLPAIKEFLTRHRLQFLGFELSEPLWRGYAARFPADAARIDLDCWHVFETENPRSFKGMYQFWVQKPAAT
jgi:Flp pilus assembly protein TadD/SAM-dependent methyltransferase